MLSELKGLVGICSRAPQRAGKAARAPGHQVTAKQGHGQAELERMGQALEA